MLLMQKRGYCRTVFLVALVALLSIDLPVNAESEHSHRGDEAVASATSGVARINAQSEAYQLVGSLKDGLLTLHLKRRPEGSPVAGAEIELTIGGETGAAAAKVGGSYTYRSAALKKDGEREVIISITDGNKSDLLIGVLKDGASAEKHADHKGHGSKAKNKTSADGEHEDHGNEGEDHGNEGEDHGNEGEDNGNEGAVKLTSELMREFGVATEQASAGSLAVSITRPAEITFNMDRFTHVVPRVTGIAISIKASQGDAVRAGQVLAVLESRELAELKQADAEFAVRKVALNHMHAIGARFPAILRICGARARHSS